MKKIPYLIAVLFFLILSYSFSQPLNDQIDLSNGWVFKTGDNPDYAKSGFNDKDWVSINVNKQWESQGFENYDGIGWYRTKVFIPSSLKKENANLKGLKFILGKIDDNDVTFLNGVEIGHTEDWTLRREYIVNYDQIHWDKENTIAIRVTDTVGGGGMYSSPHSICEVKVPDVISIVSDAPYSLVDPSQIVELTKEFSFKLFAPVNLIKGKLIIKVINQKDKKMVFNETRDIALGNGNETNFSYTFKVTDGGSYKAYYSFIDNIGNDTTSIASLVCYKKINRPNEKKVLPIVAEKIPDRVNQFSFEDIKLSGYLQNRVNANLEERLLKIDEVGILEGFYNRPGKQTWVGEYPGKYLHAAARAWQYSHNEQLKTQMDRIVDILIESQKPDGYLGTYVPADYWTDWDVWAHKYDMLGLLSYYSATDYKPALDACIKIGDLLCRTFGKNKGQLNIIDVGYHVGMASCSVLEPMTYLYRFTGDKKYLDFCNYIIDAYGSENGPKIITTLLKVGRVDKTANAKAYEMMSNLIGIVKLYQLTGEERLIKAAKIAWDDIAKNRLYITGTSSKGERFQNDDVFPAENEDHMGEGCVSTTWVQFTQALFTLTGESKYIDELEKTIYNHLFAAENPLTGCVSYYTALQGVKPYRCTIMAHCCLASVPRAIAAIPEFVFSKFADNGFAINLYSSGEAKGNITTKAGKVIPIQFSINTNFPKDNKVKINLISSDKDEFKIALRVPSWCKDYSATVDGKKYSGLPGKYLVIDKAWEKNSVIDISFGMNTRELDGGKSYPGFVAVKTGTQVLAFDQMLNPEIKDIDKLKIVSSNIKLMPSKTKLPEGWFGSEIYDVPGIYENKNVSLKLVPFAEAGQTGGEVRVWIKSSSY